MKKILLTLCSLVPLCVLGQVQTGYQFFNGFLENRGQLHDENNIARPDILFYGQSAELSYYLEKDGISLQVATPGISNPARKFKNMRAVSSQYTVSRVDLKWLNADASVQIVKDAKRSGKSYFYTIDQPQEATTVDAVTYRNLYSGIDLKYYTNSDGFLEYDLVVSSGADYRQIKLEIKGALGIKKEQDGGVLIQTASGVIHEGQPIVRQGSSRLNADWHVEGNVLTFDIRSYDPLLPIVIDPVILAYGTYYGGGGISPSSIQCDKGGNIFVAGAVSNVINIATSGAYQIANLGESDAFIAKFDSTKHLLWATYFGSDSLDEAHKLALDELGNIYIAGRTHSPNGLSTSGAYQVHCNSCREIVNSVGDGFVAKFDAFGRLKWSTYFGGAEDDEANGVSVDNAGNVYLAGRTQSTTSMATSGAHQTMIAGLVDAFIAKFDSLGGLLWSTYYGGPSTVDIAWDCSVDVSGNLFVTGVTASASGVATAGTHKVTLTSDQESYIAKFSSSGVLLWGSYYGGSVAADASTATYSYGCSTDTLGNVFISGFTNAHSGIATSGAHQPSLAGEHDGYVAKFNSSGALLWGTYYGGPAGDEGSNCHANERGEVCITGWTLSGSGIASSDGYRTSCDSCDPLSEYTADAFVASFSPTGVWEWGSYYGGGKGDFGLDCFINSAGAVYVAGSTVSTGLPITSDAYVTFCDSCSYAGASFIAEFVNHPTGIQNWNENAINDIVYPNPANDFLNIKGKAPSFVLIKNVFGQTLICEKNVNQIRIKDLDNGIYFVEIVGENGTVTSSKIVKN